MNSRSISEVMSESLGISAIDLKRLIARAPYSYKVYTIPKKSGGRRTIAHPARETKYLQRWLIRNVFGELPVSEAASAYAPGTSIKRNASAHKSNPYLVKLDFRSFFTSIKGSDVLQHLEQHLSTQFPAQDWQSIVRICCYRARADRQLCLSVGAPTSPLLSNSILCEFDMRAMKWARENGFVFTRYADDLTFSTSEKTISASVEPYIRSLIRDLRYPRLRINTEKTIHASKKGRRRVTGLIVTNENRISIGRDRKRTIRAKMHQFSLGRMEPSEIQELKGLLAFAQDVEPLFLSRMRARYGSEAINAVLRFETNE